MSKYVKELMMDQLKSDLDGNRSLLIVDLKDLDAIAEHNFRRDLRKKSIRIRVLKNSLAKRVFSDVGHGGLSKYLEGQSAVVWGGEGPSELAKEISTRFKALKKPQIKGGAVDGVIVGPEQVDDITKLPSREVLIGQVLSLVLGPAQQTLSLLNSSASTLVGQLEALAKRQEEAGAARLPFRRKAARARLSFRRRAAEPLGKGSTTRKYLTSHVICRDDNRSERMFSRFPPGADRTSKLSRGLEHTQPSTFSFQQERNIRPMSTAEATTFADSIKTLGDTLVNMKVLEVLQLTKYLKETYNLEAAAVAVAGPAAGGAQRPQARPPRPSRPSSTSRSRLSAPTRSRSSRLCVPPPSLASKRQKTWWKQRPRTSRPASPRRMPRNSRKSSKTPARPSRSNDLRES